MSEEDTPSVDEHPLAFINRFFGSTWAFSTVETEHGSVCIATDSHGFCMSRSTWNAIVHGCNKFYEHTTDEEIETANRDNMERWFPNEYQKESRKPPKPKRKPKPGYLYVLKLDTCYKIGIAKNVEERMKQLQTAHPSSLELVHKVRCTDSLAVEREMHTRFAGRQRNGEWFELDQSDIDYIRSL